MGKWGRERPEMAALRHFFPASDAVGKIYYSRLDEFIMRTAVASRGRCL